LEKLCYNYEKFNALEGFMKLKKFLVSIVAVAMILSVAAVVPLIAGADYEWDWWDCKLQGFHYGRDNFGVCKACGDKWNCQAEGWHWFDYSTYICDICGVKRDCEAEGWHIWDDSTYVCNACGVKWDCEVNRHSWDYSTDICDVCGMKWNCEVEERHSWNYSNHTCNICGVKWNCKIDGHAWDDNETGIACLLCGEKRDCNIYGHAFDGKGPDYCLGCRLSSCVILGHYFLNGVCTRCNAREGEVPTSTPPVAPYSKGDIRGDGNIDVSNAVEILKYIAGLPNIISGNAQALAAADANGDGEIDVQDAIEILRYIAGLSNAISG